MVAVVTTALVGMFQYDPFHGPSPNKRRVAAPLEFSPTVNVGGPDWFAQSAVVGLACWIKQYPPGAQFMVGSTLTGNARAGSLSQVGSTCTESWVPESDIVTGPATPLASVTLGAAISNCGVRLATLVRTTESCGVTEAASPVVVSVQVKVAGADAEVSTSDSWRWVVPTWYCTSTPGSAEG
jgi:hypothetical protein